MLVSCHPQNKWPFNILTPASWKAQTFIWHETPAAHYKIRVMQKKIWDIKEWLLYDSYCGHHDRYMSHLCTNANRKDQHHASKYKKNSHAHIKVSCRLIYDKQLFFFTFIDSYLLWNNQTTFLSNITVWQSSKTTNYRVTKRIHEQRVHRHAP